MSIARVLLPVLVVGGVVAAMSSTASAKGGAAAGRSLSPAQAADIEKVLATADPRAIRELAADLERAGFAQQARDLREAADAIEQAVRNVPPVKPGDKPAIKLPDGRIPGGGGGAARAPEAPSPERLMAGKTALMLTNSSPGRENKAMVKDFQLQEQGLGHVEVGKADGLYGPKTALVLAKRYAIVPPKPYYWPRQDRAGAKSAYAAELLALAARDKPRAEEWRAAARV